MHDTVNFKALFDAKSVAVIGASNTPGKWGFGIISIILIKGGRAIYPINTNSDEILGINAYKTLRDVPGPVDVAVIAAPAQYVPSAIEDCAYKGVKFAVIFSGGFSEIGGEGATMQSQITQIAHESGIRLVGPNCMGHFDAYSDFFTFPYELPVKEGPVSIITQSGNSGVALLSMMVEAGLGASKYVSTGNETDLHFEDYLEYFGNDDKTEVIIGYVEALREGPRFLQLAKSITKNKPIVLLKAGRSDAGRRAAHSHTASMAGSDEITVGAFKQSGVILVDELHELIDVAQAFIGQPLPKGKRIGLFSMGGGLGVISTDALRRYGLEMAEFSSGTMNKLDAVLSSRWSHGNPVDPAGDPVIYPCIWPLLEDENVDAVMVVGGVGIVGGLATLLPRHHAVMKDYEDMMKVAEKEELANLDLLAKMRGKHRKPIVLASMQTGAVGKRSLKVIDTMLKNNLVRYPTPHRAAKVLSCLIEYSQYRGFFEEGNRY